MPLACHFSLTVVLLIRSRTYCRQLLPNFDYTALTIHCAINNAPPAGNDNGGNGIESVKLKILYHIVHIVRLFTAMLTPADDPITVISGQQLHVLKPKRVPKHE